MGRNKVGLIVRFVWRCNPVVGAVTAGICVVPEAGWFSVCLQPIRTKMASQTRWKSNTSAHTHTLGILTWWAAIEAAWRSQRKWPSRWPDPGSAAADMKAIYKTEKPEHQYNKHDWSLQLTDSKPKWSLCTCTGLRKCRPNICSGPNVWGLCVSASLSPS